MNKMYFINNPQVFQGKNKIQHKSNYFEGWYFKNSNGTNSVSFIPGINIENGKKYAFIQIITNTSSYFIPFTFEEFSYSYSPFWIKIGNNYFSPDNINIDINYKDIKINGSLSYSKVTELNKSTLSPNIMGPFSFIPFMECNHAIISMKHSVTGHLNVNNVLYDFNDGKGYIEKDWGTSFSKSYIWAQGNCFKDSTSSFFISVANIPFMHFEFLGFICVLILNGREYRFATYNNSKLRKYSIENNNINIILENKGRKLYIISENRNSHKLKSPKNGNMKNYIQESLDSEIKITLVENNTVIFKNTSTNCGLELVK